MACTLFRFLFQDLHELFSRDGFLFIEVLCELIELFAMFLKEPPCLLMLRLDALKFESRKNIYPLCESS